MPLHKQLYQPTKTVHMYIVSEKSKNNNINSVLKANLQVYLG